MLDVSLEGLRERAAQNTGLPRLYQHSQYAVPLRKPLFPFLKEAAVALLHCQQLLLKSRALSCMQCKFGNRLTFTKLGYHEVSEEQVNFCTASQPVFLLLLPPGRREQTPTRMACKRPALCVKTVSVVVAPNGEHSEPAFLHGVRRIASVILLQNQACSCARHRSLPKC